MTARPFGLHPGDPRVPLLAALYAERYEPPPRREPDSPDRAASRRAELLAAIDDEEGDR